ncbi:MAG: diguanylate cyclase [Nakamurella sp.]
MPPPRAAPVLAATRPSAPDAVLNPPTDPDPVMTEADRLAELDSFDILDTPAEPGFDALVELAAHLSGTPIALITLIDGRRQWFKARYGLDMVETAREASFCTHLLQRCGPMVVPDAIADPRFVSHPMVVGEPRVRFYAGVPLVAPSGAVLGSLCVLDSRTRELSAAPLPQLAQLAAQVIAQLLLRRRTRELVAELAAHRAAEEASLANDRLLRGVLSHPDAIIFAKDRNGRYLLCNTAGHQRFGVPDGSLLGRSDTEMLDPTSASVLRRTDRRVLEAGERISVTETFSQTGGIRRDYQTTKFPLRDADGVVYALAGISTDITTQLAAERALQQSERRWRKLFDASPVGIGLIDEHGTYVAVNPALCALLGRPTTGVLDHPTTEFVHPADRFDVARTAALIAAAPDGIAHTETRCLLPDGRHRWIWSTLASTSGPDGQTWTVAHLQDITERLTAEHAARDSQADLSAVVEVVQRVQTAADAGHIVVQACLELAGADLVYLLEPTTDADGLQVTAGNDVAPRGLRVSLRAGDADGLALDPRAAAFLSGRSILTAHRLPDTPGVVPGAPGAGYVVPIRSGSRISAVLVVEWAAPGPGPSDRRAQVVSMLAEQVGIALHQRSLLTELEMLAHTDELTGLPNRRSWEARLQTVMTTVNAGRGLIVALIDFDHFKGYNDTRGHASGDALLAGFARRARGLLKTGDMLARWGGEEFALSLVDCSPTDAATVLQRIRGAMPDGQTCSIGYVVVDVSDRPDDLMIRADNALYRAKNSGRDRVCRDHD